MNFFTGFNPSQNGNNNNNNGQEKSFSQGMNDFFSNIFNSSPFFNPQQPQQQQQQNHFQFNSNSSQQPQQQQQQFQSSQSFNYNNNNQHHNNNHPPRFQSSQNYSTYSSQQQNNNNRPTYPRFGSQSNSNSQSSQQQQQYYNQPNQQNNNNNMNGNNNSRNRNQSSSSSASSQSQSQQNSQNNNPQRNMRQNSNQNQNQYNQQQPQPDVRPTFQNTRSNWRKAEEQPKKENKKKEIQKEDTSDYWKQKANELYKKGYLDTAIEYYSKAINIDNSQSIYFSNRGRCYKNKRDLKKAFDDAVQAMELDDRNLKGHLLCGQVLCEMGKYEEGYHKIENGIKKLTKGLTLCSSQAGEKKKVFEKEISVYIFRAKKLLWYKQYEEQKQKKIRLIENYKTYLEQLNTLTDQQRQIQMDDFIFTVGDPYKEDDLTIPDYLCCKITLDLIEDPVTTEAGHTYEREVIEDHFKKNGYIDPFTRNNVRPHLYPNHAVKQGVEDFLAKNPWAYEHTYNEDYRKIEF